MKLNTWQKTVNILRPNFKQIKSVVQPVLDKPFYQSY